MLNPTTYKLLQEGKEAEEFSSAADAGKAWERALTWDTSVMKYREGDGQWKTMAVVGFDGRAFYKDMPFSDRPGAAEFVAAHDAARGPNYKSPQMDEEIFF